MKDGIIKGTGNSRFLKSSIAETTTLQQLISMLRSGTFPVDFNGINSAGWDVVGTALNKANLLTDETAEALNMTDEDPTLDDALFKLQTNIGALWTYLYRLPWLSFGTYTGTGAHGFGNPNTLTFSFVPHVVWINATAAGTAAAGVQGCLVRNGFGGANLRSAWEGNSVSWYTTSTTDSAPDFQFNKQDMVYTYCAI